MLKPPPHSVEAEESFLSACLLGAANEGVELLSPEDFYRTAHRHVFDAICDRAKHRDVGVVSVIEYLRNNKQLEAIGGAAQVARLLDTVPSTGGLESCAEIIKRNATRRRVIEACSMASQACYESDDIDGILTNLGNRLLQAEQCLCADDWVKMGQLSDPMIEKWETQRGKQVTGISTGLIDIDYFLSGWQPATLYIVAGRPSMGKTAFALKTARHAARCGYPVAFRSIEMSKEQIFTRATSDVSGVDSERLRSGDLDGTHWDAIVEAVGRINDLPIYIDDKPTEKIRTLQRNIRQFTKRYGKGLVVVDYLQYIEGEKAERYDLSIGSVSRGLKASARELDIPIVLLAQLNRSLESRDNKRPRKSDLRGSGEIEQDADVIAFLYRDEVYDPKTTEPGVAEFIIDKHRDGKIGTVKMAWVAHRATFENLARKV